jgi:SAM-dependent methyltransferase
LTAIAGENPCRHELELTLFPAVDYITRERFDVRRCETCGLVRTHPAPANLDRYYPSGYYGAAEDRYGPLATRFLSIVHGARARRITALHRGPGAVVDVGCGPGLLLEALRRCGWTVRGIERTEGAAAFARDRLGIDVHVGDWRDSRIAAGELDAVILWHVLEHLAAPEECLAWAAERLTPGGVAVIASPDFASLEARWTRDRWFHLDVPRHLIHFTRDTLGAAVRRTGLDIVGTSGVAPEYDLFSFVQSTLNYAGMSPNTLFTMTRRAGARVADASNLDRIASVVLGIPLAALGLPLTIVAGTIGAGATVTLYCRKPG